MDNNLTEVVFIIDRSGSMSTLEKDTIGGFNSFVEKQKNEPGRSLLIVVLFDDNYEILYDGVDINKVPTLTSREYWARGTTALLDAVGRTINLVGARLSKTKESDRPSNVLFVITTDGMENASKEFTKETIKDMVEHQTIFYNWKFLFLGANIDSISVGNSYGFNLTTNYTDSNIGTRSVYDVVSSTLTSLKKSGEIDEDWDKDIK